MKKLHIYLLLCMFIITKYTAIKALNTKENQLTQSLLRDIQTMQNSSSNINQESLHDFDSLKSILEHNNCLLQSFIKKESWKKLKETIEIYTLDESISEQDRFTKPSKIAAKIMLPLHQSFISMGLAIEQSSPLYVVTESGPNLDKIQIRIFKNLAAKCSQFYLEQQNAAASLYKKSAFLCGSIATIGLIFKPFYKESMISSVLF